MSAPWKLHRSERYLAAHADICRQFDHANNILDVIEKALGSIRCLADADRYTAYGPLRGYASAKSARASYQLVVLFKPDDEELTVRLCDVRIKRPAAPPTGRTTSRS